LELYVELDSLSLSRKRGEEMGEGKMKTATESAAKLPALESCPKAWNWTRVWQSVLQQGLKLPLPLSVPFAVPFD